MQTGPVIESLEQAADLAKNMVGETRSMEDHLYRTSEEMSIEIRWNHSLPCHDDKISESYIGLDYLACQQ